MWLRKNEFNLKIQIEFFEPVLIPAIRQKLFYSGSTLTENRAYCEHNGKMEVTGEIISGKEVLALLTEGVFNTVS